MIDDGFLINIHDSIKSTMLDDYLAAGWYRHGQYIFTIDKVIENNRIQHVFWLRYKVFSVKLSRNSRQLMQRNRRFNVSVKPFHLTAELEELHQQYLTSITFKTVSTIEELLEDPDRNIYDTHLIEVRDGNKLIAAGIFDKGQNSIAGIKNFYDPEYKKYSPGRYLVLLKFNNCIAENRAFYYPGYFSPDNPRFDYKLFLDKNATEFYVPLTDEWLPFEKFESGNFLVDSQPLF